MKDRLEEFIRNNKEAFDDREPSEKVWTNINASLGLRRTTVWNSLALWRAAAVIFMVLCGYLLLPKANMNLAKDNVSNVSTEFDDVEAFYIRQISEKIEMIDEFQKSEGLNGFTHDFQQLEAMYMVLKEEMKTRPSQKVKDALVLNLLVRIDLLNQQLHKLEKEYKKDNQEPKETA